MTEDSKPWHAAFPAPRTTAHVIMREEVLKDLSSNDLLLVDVRRTDFEGGTIKGSLNLPAHSFYMNRAVFFDLCKRAGVKRVAFYCGEYILHWACLCCRCCAAGMVSTVTTTLQHA